MAGRMGRQLRRLPTPARPTRGHRRLVAAATVARRPGSTRHGRNHRSMNAELAAMNKISKVVETATAGLDPGARGRVLSWFAAWTDAQLVTTTDTAKEPTA